MTAGCSLYRPSSTPVRASSRHHSGARNNLALWLGYTQLPTGGSAPPAGGAPAQVFAIRPRRPGRG
jgi:hypothetical protein